jgi:hypothetical protein
MKFINNELIKNINKRLSNSWFLTGFIAFIIFFNITFYHLEENIKSTRFQKRWDASGFSYGKAQHFFYFYYYLNYFPIAILGEKEYSKEDAETLLNTNGNEAIMEYQHWTRLGENARIWAFYPNGLLKGSAERPSVKAFNAIIFILGLLFCFYGFYKIGKPLEGAILTSAVNLTPFYLYEIYQNENIFGLLGSVFLIILGLNIFLIYSQKRSVNILTTILIVVTSGALIGFSSELRAEIKVILGSLVLIYLVTNKIKWIAKLSIIIILIISYSSVKRGIRSYFDNKFAEAKQIVEAHNGHVYNGDRIYQHKFWHPVFCGLGDFGGDKGYYWDDRVAYNYALPILKEKYGLDYKYSNKYHLDEYYDDSKKYYKKFDEIEEYEMIMKEKVISDIKEDKGWYLNILLNRIWQAMIFTVPFNSIGILLIAFTIGFIVKKKYNHLKLLLISLPLTATPIIIYSQRGTTYNSFYPFIVLVFLILLLIEINYTEVYSRLKSLIKR